MDVLPMPEDDLEWSFARSGGPGGQNVNKVASKAVLSWDLANSPHVSVGVKERLPRLYPRYATSDGRVVITSQEHRDQEKNRQACLDKLLDILTESAKVPKTRRKTKPTRGSQRRRLEGKKQRSETKEGRRRPAED